MSGSRSRPFWRAVLPMPGSAAIRPLFPRAAECEGRRRVPLAGEMGAASGRPVVQPLQPCGPQAVGFGSGARHADALDLAGQLVIHEPPIQPVVVVDTAFDRETANGILARGASHFPSSFRLQCEREDRASQRRRVVGRNGQAPSRRLRPLLRYRRHRLRPSAARLRGPRSPHSRKPS